MTWAAPVFLRKLFYDYNLSDTARFEIRAIYRDGTPTKQKYFPLREQSYQRVSKALVQLCGDADVYVGVLPRSSENGADVDVCASLFLYCDIDAGESGYMGVASLLRAFKANERNFPAPSMIVASGSGGGHCYWQLDEQFVMDGRDSRDAMKAVLRRLCLAIGGEAPQAHADRSCVNASRILRVPGTRNHKFDPPVTVELQVIPSEPRSFDWWVANLPYEPVKIHPPRKKFNVRHSDDIPPKLLAWAMEGYPEGNRHHDLTGAAKFLKRDCGLSDDRGFALFAIKANASHGARTIDDSEIEYIWNWA